MSRRQGRTARLQRGCWHLHCYHDPTDQHRLQMHLGPTHDLPDQDRPLRLVLPLGRHRNEPVVHVDRQRCEPGELDLEAEAGGAAAQGLECDRYLRPVRLPQGRRRNLRAP